MFIEMCPFCLSKLIKPKFEIGTLECRNSCYKFMNIDDDEYDGEYLEEYKIGKYTVRNYARYKNIFNYSNMNNITHIKDWKFDSRIRYSNSTNTRINQIILNEIYLSPFRMTEKKLQTYITFS